MRTTILLGLLLGHLACSGGGGIKRAGVDASPEGASPTGSPSTDSGRPATDGGGPGLAPDSAAMVFPDAAPDRPSDQTVFSDGRLDRFDLRPDVRAEPSPTPSGTFEMLDDSPMTASPDAGQCVPGFIRAYVFEFPTGAQTVKVHPVSSIKSFPMDGTLSDTSGSALRYDLNDPSGQPAGELQVWPQGGAWSAQLTVYGSRPDSGCVRGELILKSPT